MVGILAGSFRKPHTKTADPNVIARHSLHIGIFHTLIFIFVYQIVFVFSVVIFFGQVLDRLA